MFDLFYLIIPAAIGFILTTLVATWLIPDIPFKRQISGVLGLVVFFILLIRAYSQV